MKTVTRTHFVVILLVGWWMLGAPRPLLPQTPDQPINSLSLKSTLRDIAGDFWYIYTAPLRMSRAGAIRTLELGVLSAGCVVLVDDPVYEEYVNEKHHLLLKPAKWLAHLGQVYDHKTTAYVLSGVGVATLAAGIVFKKPELTATTRLMLESFVISETLTLVGKVGFSRARPYMGQGAFAFRPLAFRRENAYHSMPSGHTTSIFAIVTVLAKRHDHWWVKYPGYFFATCVALQRIDTRNHWTSDTLVGGLIGYWVGSALVTKQRGDKKSAWQPYLLPDRLGMALRF